VVFMACVLSGAGVEIDKWARRRAPLQLRALVSTRTPRLGRNQSSIVRLVFGDKRFNSGHPTEGLVSSFVFDVLYGDDSLFAFQGGGLEVAGVDVMAKPGDEVVSQLAVSG